jgi:hypothetical protein
VPCGLDGVQMTSLIGETGREAGQMPCFSKRAAFAVASALERRQRLVSRSRLEAAIPTAVAPVVEIPAPAAVRTARLRAGHGPGHLSEPHVRFDAQPPFQRAGKDMPRGSQT